MQLFSNLLSHRPAEGTRFFAGEGIAPDGAGVVSIGARALSESGTVGSWERSQIELFCISKLINCVLESDEEFVCMDLHFAVGASYSGFVLPAHLCCYAAVGKS